MKRAVVTLLLVAGMCLAYPLVAQEKASPPGDGSVAHGAADQTREVVGHEGEHHAAREDYFGIPVWIWKLANMVLFIGALGYVLGGPIRKTFDARREGIRKELLEAEDRRAKADQFAAEIDERLKNLEREVASILERASEDGARHRDQLIATAEADAKKIVATARNEVEARLKMARKELTEYAGELAAARAREIVAQSVTDVDRKRLFDSSVDEIAKVQS